MTGPEKYINYRASIPGGIALLGLGVVFGAAVSFAMGIVFIASGIACLLMGMVNRSKDIVSEKYPEGNLLVGV